MILAAVIAASPAAAIAYGVRAVLESGVEPSLSKSRRVAALWSSTCF